MPGNKSSLHEFNESLIARGHFLIDFGFLKLRDKEIKYMNEGKSVHLMSILIRIFTSWLS